MTLIVLIILSFLSCSVEVGFEQEIDLLFPPASVETRTNISVVVSEGALSDGLQKGGYSLGEFDNFTLDEAYVVCVVPGSDWVDYIGDFVISFRNDSLTRTVFNCGACVAGDKQDLSISDDEMLAFLQGRAFIVDASGTLKPGSPQLLFQIFLKGTLSTTAP